MKVLIIEDDAELAAAMSDYLVLQGNWESQSMDDRADEVIAAMDMLKKVLRLSRTKLT